MTDEPLKPQEARKLVREILESGEQSLFYSGHARLEMDDDEISEAEIERALRGLVEPAEWEGGQWRYRFHAGNVWVVVALLDGLKIIVITAWRKK